ncbi:MAG: hypothetical protein U0841_13390 [Chloroflexia bacterium]
MHHEVIPPSPARRRVARGGSLAGGLLLGSLLTALLVLFVGMPLALTRSTPLPLEEHYAGYALDMAVGRRAGDAANPLAGNAEAIEAGGAAYQKACAGCTRPTARGGAAPPAGVLLPTG